MVEAALNANANVPEFIAQFKPDFPVGTANDMAALSYLEISPVIRTFVPYIAFVDRTGVIRAQFTGTDLPDAKQDQILRETAQKLLSEGAPPAKPQARRTKR